MSEPVVIRNERDGVLELVLNRPDKLNAINQEVLDVLALAVEDLRTEDRHRVMLIRGRGRYFSAGADLAAFTDHPEGRSGLRVRGWFRRQLGGMQTLWQEMELVEKPIVVAHHAMCIGAGLEMSLSCDFRLAAASAEYWFPEMKMAVLPLSGGVSRLARFCGPHWAKWMVLANEKVDAQQALTMGLVQKVYPDESFEAEVWAFCQRLASFPPEAMAMAKLATDLAADMESANARQLERLAYSNLVALDEQAEARREHHRKILKNQ